MDPRLFRESASAKKACLALPMCGRGENFYPVTKTIEVIKMKFLSLILVAMMAITANAVVHPPITVVTLGTRTTTGVTTGAEFKGINRACQVVGTTSAGSGAASVKIEGSLTNVATDFVVLATVALTLGTAQTTDGFTSLAPWKYLRANVESISGTGASVTAYCATNGN